MPRFGESTGEYRGITYRDAAALNAWLAKRPAEAALEPDLPIIDPHGFPPITKYRAGARRGSRCEPGDATQ